MKKRVMITTKINKAQIFRSKGTIISLPVIEPKKEMQVWISFEGRREGKNGHLAVIRDLEIRGSCYINYLDGRHDAAFMSHTELKTLAIKYENGLAHLADDEWRKVLDLNLVNNETEVEFSYVEGSYQKIRENEEWFVRYDHPIGRVILELDARVYSKTELITYLQEFGQHIALQVGSTSIHNLRKNKAEEWFHEKHKK